MVVMPPAPVLGIWRQKEWEFGTKLGSFKKQSTGYIDKLKNKNKLELTDADAVLQHHVWSI